MILVALGVVSMLLAGGFALPRARRELEISGRLSTPTFVAALLAYFGLGICALLAAWWSVWPLSLPRALAHTAGGLLAGAGMLLYVAARMRFQSFRLTWGLCMDRLVTGGVYSLTRNPQSVGWLLVLAGAGIASRSGGTLVLAAVYALSCIVWLPVEERILERHFGEEYRRYRETVPRYLGLPRDRVDRGNV